MLERRRRLHDKFLDRHGLRLTTAQKLLLPLRVLALGRLAWASHLTTSSRCICCNTYELLETFQPNLRRVSVQKNNRCNRGLRIDCLRTRAKHDRPIASSYIERES